MIVANGCPRTGTHLVMKFLGMLGFDDSKYVLLRLSDNEDLRARLLLSEDSKKTVRLKKPLSRPDDEFAHAHAVDSSRGDLSKHKVITTFRDPRDSAVSLVRWHKHRGKLPERLQGASDEELLIDLLRNGYYAARGSTWVEFVRRFEGWRGDGWGNTLSLEYSELGTIDAAFKIAYFVDATNINLKKLIALSDEWLGNGKTYRGKPMHVSMSSQSPDGPTDWRKWWTPDVNSAWAETGGFALVKEMGY